MSWTAYKLVFEAMSDITIGADKLGFVQRTRYYIPARNLWGCVTESLTQQKHPTPTAQNYQDVGVSVAKSCKFSYLFLTDDGTVVMPWCVSESNGIHGIDPDKFERLYVSSRPRTAVGPLASVVDDASLFEFEFLRRCNNDGSSLYWTGYLWVKESTEITVAELRAVLSHIQIGGERRYGFGHLVLRSFEALVNRTEDSYTDVFGSKVFCNDQGPCIELEEKRPLPAHLSVAGLNVEMSGACELLMGRVWTQTNSHSGPGRHVVPTGLGLCWIPGSFPSVLPESVSPLRVGIADYGVCRF
jgi:hypothetical protein